MTNRKARCFMWVAQPGLAVVQQGVTLSHSELEVLAALTR